LLEIGWKQEAKTISSRAGFTSFGKRMNAVKALIAATEAPAETVYATAAPISAGILKLFPTISFRNWNQESQRCLVSRCNKKYHTNCGVQTNNGPVNNKLRKSNPPLPNVFVCAAAICRS
jgi:hypothetical protein